MPIGSNPVGGAVGTAMPHQVPPPPMRARVRTRAHPHVEPEHPRRFSDTVTFAARTEPGRSAFCRHCGAHRNSHSQDDQRLACNEDVLSGFRRLEGVELAPEVVVTGTRTRAPEPEPEPEPSIPLDRSMFSVTKREQDASCPCCRDVIDEDGEPWTRCKTCKVTYHPECWDILNRCATLGCAGHSRAPVTFAPSGVPALAETPAGVVWSSQHFEPNYDDDSCRHCGDILDYHCQDDHRFVCQASSLRTHKRGLALEAATLLQEMLVTGMVDLGEIRTLLDERRRLLRRTVVGLVALFSVLLSNSAVMPVVGSLIAVALLGVGVLLIQVRRLDQKHLRATELLELRDVDLTELDRLIE